jgi:DUF971 family protein
MKKSLSMLPSLQIAPKSIKLDAGNDTLSVRWSDGHVSNFPYRYLRDRCPCATCSEKPLADQVALPLAAPSVFPMFGVKALKPSRAELVGRYAVQIFWNDGHSSGIYAFDHLRELCPCSECASKRASKESVAGT